MKNVRLVYGKTYVKFSSSDLQLISDALDVLSPDTDESADRAHTLCASFAALAEYQKSIELESLQGTEGQDRQSYSDSQDRKGYSAEN